MGRTLQIICGVVVAIGLLGASPPEEPATKKQPETHQPTRQSPAPAATPADDHARDLTATCEKGKDNRNSDLCAQWKAADSAEVAASWARLTGIFTAVGIVVGAVTMGAAIAAAVFAREAARHTKTAAGEAKRSADASDTMAAQSVEATKAALKSATVAERALVGIERPFLVFEPAGDTADYQEYAFVNHGRTPCVIVGSAVHYLPITPLDAPEPLKPNMLQVVITPDWNVVAPNGGKTPARSAKLEKPFVLGAERAQLRMVHGYAIYRSLTGDYFECGFGLTKLGRHDEWRALGPEYNYDDRREPGVPRPNRKRTLTITAGKRQPKNGDQPRDQ